MSRRQCLKRGARILAGAALVATQGPALTGCASLVGASDPGSEQARALLASPSPPTAAHLPRQVHLSRTPFFAQTELQCGPAVLATLLQAANRPVQAEALVPQLFVPERRGSLQVEMLAAARAHDAIATRLPPQLVAVLGELVAGHPVGVMQNLGLAIAPLWHFAVLIGYDLDRREAILRSGTTRELRMDLLTFERTWARADRWAFVVLPPDRLPVTAEAPAVREGRLGFERVAPPERAAAAWQAAAERWPADLVMGMGLGNALVRAGRAAEAATAFERTAHTTDGAAAWNNLASVRLQLGQLPAARDAARRAVLRAAAAEPRLLDAAQATQAEVEAAFQAAAQPACGTITGIARRNTTCP